MKPLTILAKYDDRATVRSLYDPQGNEQLEIELSAGDTENSFTAYFTRFHWELLKAAGDKAFMELEGDNDATRNRAGIEKE